VDAERQRLAEADAGTVAWREWGPYVAERAWGTVREDYSASGDAWGSFPFDQAVSRTYRWNEDGLFAWCDGHQHVCVGVALWNGVDPILKERPFGLSGPQGNHGEDAKDYWWFVDNTPTHSYQRSRYVYPMREFPYQDLVSGNASRDRTQPEYELLDTGIFADNRYVTVTCDWAKAGPKDICLSIDVHNPGPEEVVLHVLPTVWFRNSWSWDESQPTRPRLWADGARIHGIHEKVGPITVTSAAVTSGDGALEDAAEIVFCENETNVRKLYGVEDFAGRPATRYPKDGINDQVVHGADSVNPRRIGTKAAFHHVLTVATGEHRQVRLRLRCEEGPGGLGADFTEVLSRRRGESDDFWHSVLGGLDAERAKICRQALAGLLSSKQYYAYDVERWLDGDPGQPAPPETRMAGRNGSWRYLTAQDVILMPDTWEYPWFASWDLAFHCVALALVDPTLAKEQLLLLLHEWYLHPGGQIPAYEWNFGDVNPPVHAWAARQIYEIDGARDRVFLERAMHKLLINFTWWVNRKDAEGNNLFEGGFLGLDNIGAFDRSAPLPGGAVLEQSDGTAWMAMYCLNMLRIAVALSDDRHTYDDIAVKFLDHFCYIATAANDLGLWDPDDGFYYDVLRLPGGVTSRMTIRSVVGLIPLMAVARLGEQALAEMPALADRMDWLRAHRPEFTAAIHFEQSAHPGLLALCDPARLLEVLRAVLDTNEFLSSYGLRSLSAIHREHPAVISVDGQTFTVDYEPGESSIGLFGGNSNWRGPIWFPVNSLLIGALRRYGEYFGNTYRVEDPAGSGQLHDLGEIAESLSDRLMALFLPGPNGDRPCQAGLPWQDDVLFAEYFHGDTGFGLGATHQTGWTAMIAPLALGWPR
jgi:hypothetical protein